MVWHTTYTHLWYILRLYRLCTGIYMYMYQHVHQYLPVVPPAVPMKNHNVCYTQVECKIICLLFNTYLVHIIMWCGLTYIR